MKMIHTMLVLLTFALATVLGVSPSNANDNLTLPVLEQGDLVTASVIDAALFPEVCIEKAVAAYPLPLRSSYAVNDSGYHFAIYTRNTGYDSHRITDRISPVYRPSYERSVVSTGSPYGFLVQRE